MPCSWSKWVVLAALSVASCSRDNPLFGDGDTGEGSGSTGGSATTTMGIESSVGSQSTTQSSSSSDPDTGSEVGSDSSGTSSTPECGNGIKEEPEEECDDGPANAEDGFCLRDCTKNVCGDGHLAPNQPCDDMNEDPEDGCHECVLTSCGNGMVEGEEECDDGEKGSNMCTPNCTLPECGDMFVTPPEACDDGNESDVDGCIQCVTATCGDGLTWEDVEECDDHNVVDDDGCSSTCLAEFCGDDIVQASEECEGNSGSPLMCQGESGELQLQCDTKTCLWVVEGGDDCCMPISTACVANVPCCGELVCDAMTLLCSQG